MEPNNTLTTAEAAGYLKLSKRYLEKRRVTGGGPRFCKDGRIVRYRRQDLDEYLERYVVNSTSEATLRDLS